MMRNLGSVCAKLRRRGRSYSAGTGSKSDDILDDEKLSVTISGLVFSTICGYVCYRVIGGRERHRLYEKEKLLLLQHEDKVAQLDKAQKKHLECRVAQLEKKLSEMGSTS